MSFQDRFEELHRRYRAAGLSQALDVLHTKRDTNPPRKHGNIPL